MGPITSGWSQGILGDLARRVNEELQTQNDDLCSGFLFFGGGGASEAGRKPAGITAHGWEVVLVLGPTRGPTEATRPISL